MNRAELKRMFLVAAQVVVAQTITAFTASGLNIWQAVTNTPALAKIAASAVSGIWWVLVQLGIRFVSKPFGSLMVSGNNPAVVEPPHTQGAG